MINRRGYEVVSEEEYFNDIMSELKTVYPNMSDSPSNLLTVLARVMARNENARDYDRVESYSNAYVATATGQALSKAVRTAGIARISGTRAVGKVVITKDDNISQIIIPKNMVVLSGSLEYETTNKDAVIVNSDEFEIEIASVSVGSEYNIAVGSKFNPVLNIRGVKSISATTEIFGGTSVETDLALRKRYFERMNAYSNSSLNGIIDAVKSITDVFMVSGDENVEDVEVNGLKPHSFIVYVAGGTDSDIADTIFKTKPAGIQMNGNVEVEVVFSDKTHKILFSRFSNQEVYYKIEVAIDRSIAPSNFDEIIKNEIISYTNSNNKIVSYELTNYISQSIESVRGVKSLMFGLSPNPDSNEDLIAPSGLNFIANFDNIEVVVI